MKFPMAFAKFFIVETISQLKLFRPRFLRSSVVVVAALFSPLLSATELGMQWTYWTQGSRVIISLDPTLPRRGESFKVVVSGTWPNRCTDMIKSLYYSRYFQEGQYIVVGAPSLGYSSTQTCGEEYEPTHFSSSVEIPGSVWEFIDEKKPFNVFLQLTPQLVDPYKWSREFDLSWGLHEIPPRIGQGHWVSEQRPFQGLNVEQQGDTVLLYQLSYYTDDGKSSWRMGDATFHGDITNGIAYDVSLLNFTEGYDSILHDLEHLEEDDLSIDHWSFGIDVEGVNQIKVYFIANNQAVTYKRYVFRLADNQLPVVVPDMAGKWNLYAFDNQNLEQAFPIEFRAAVKTGDGLYRFKSIDDQWILDCWVNLDGVGSCDLSNEASGIKMTYDLLDFNGNYAKAPLTSSDSLATQTGILLRDGFRLPVLDSM